MQGFQGVYELAEASRYLSLTGPRGAMYPNVRRWVRSGVLWPEASCTHAKEFYLTFGDLVSLRMIVTLRAAGFSFQRIRRVHGELQRITGCSRPFALKDLWVSETDVFVEMEGWLAVTRRGQYAMEFVKDWLRHLPRYPSYLPDLSFREAGGYEVASAWMPRLHVLLNPLVQFGAPCIEGTRIPTRAVWSMYLGGDRLDAIADDYNVPLEKAMAALDWERSVAELVC